MSDVEWAFFAPFLIENRTRGGRRPLDHRRVPDSILYVTRTGVPWHDLPPGFGNWNSAYRQYRRWTEAGVRDVMLAAFRRQRSLRQRTANDRFHHNPGASARRRRKGGLIQSNGIGRSRGGLTTKVQTRANAEGLAVGFPVTRAHASDMTVYDDLMAEGMGLTSNLLQQNC